MGKQSYLCVRIHIYIPIQPEYSPKPMQFLVKCIKASFRTATLQSVTIFFRRKINLMYRYLSSAVRQDKTVFAVDLLCFYSFCHLCFFITHISHGMRYLISTSCCAVHLYVLYIDQWDQTIFNGMILLYTWESQIHPYHMSTRLIHLWSVTPEHIKSMYCQAKYNGKKIRFFFF